MVDMTKTTTEKKLTPSDIRGVFLRSNLFQGSWNFERMQALGFCFSMVPAIRRLYPENNDARKQAIKRHLEFFNTHPYVAAPVLGVTLAMEEKRANGAEIDDGAINGIKVGLMGPLAGVGDPIFWGTVRPVFAALGAGIAMSGSLLGPLLFFILFNLVRLATRYYGVAYGYRKGVDIVKDMGGGFLQNFYLQTVLGRSEVETGLLLTPWPLATMVMAPLAGYLIERLHAGLLGALGMVIMAAGLFALVMLPASPSDLNIIWPMILCGAGFGLFQSPNNHTIITSAPRERSGGASGMLGTARLLGQSTGAALVALMLNQFGDSGTHLSLLAAAILATLAAVVSGLRITQPRVQA